MRALTLHQPWASLIAVGAKTIETRSWATKHRGPIAIHAGLKAVQVPDVSMHLWSRAMAGEPHLPTGAVVAIAWLFDCIPIVTVPRDLPDGPFVYADPGNFLQVHDGPDDHVPLYMEDEVHYGDYRHGRWAWLLSRVEPVTPSVAARGRQGLWNWDPA